MDYYKAVQEAKRGVSVESVVSGRVIRPSELGHIWVGDHWAAHNNIYLTKEEVCGLWKLSEE